MKWSRKLGRILGIDVYLHLMFLLRLGFAGLAQVGEVMRSAYVTLRVDQSLDKALASRT